MPGQRPILAMSFVASLGITLEVLSCTLPKGEGNFWPLVIFVFYLLLPIPTMMSRRAIKDTALGSNVGSSNKMRDYSLFLTSGIMVSSIALPIVMARTPVDKPVIAPISCFLVELGNILCHATIGLFCIYFKPLNGI